MASEKESRKDRLLIVQPWFTALGHPAQSLYNTMRVLTQVSGIDYLVSRSALFEHHSHLDQALGPGQRLFRFNVSNSDLRKNTVASLWSVLARIRKFRHVHHILFFDMDLGRVAKWWPLLGPLIRVRQLSLLYLLGPEHIGPRGTGRHRVERLLQRSEVVLCLRTAELRQDWVAAFPGVDPARIRTIPSLEMPNSTACPQRECQDRADLRFGVLGQLRRGKSISELVPVFNCHPYIGVLKVAGTFASPAEREALSLLQSLPGFEERYLEDEELLRLTTAQDYVVVLYDLWDKRMESAVLYLAMRANRPVLVFAEGWCNRMIQQFGCGVSVARAGLDLRTFLASLPLPGSAAYADLLDGVARFRAAHRAETLLPIFLECIGFGQEGGIRH